MFERLYEEYKSKRITADEAAALVKNGYKISFGANNTMARDIDIALSKRVKELEGVTIYSKLNPMTKPFATFEANIKDSTPEEFNKRIRFVSAHFGPQDRRMNKEGGCWFVPMLFNEYPSYMRDIIKPDIVFIQVGPMDTHGNFYYGPSIAGTTGEVEGAKTLVVEVNHSMPRAHGFKMTIPLSKVDYIVKGSGEPLPDWPPVTDIDEKDKKIAGLISPLIEDESTLQLGIGSLPTAIGQALVDSDLNEIYCHTEVITDPYVDLFEAGKLHGNKYADEGKIVYSSVTGSRRVYEFVEDNPICAVAPIDYINNYTVISNIDRFISVNSCLCTDLYGQISSESIGYQHISGTGGQLDFVLGAYASKGGKSFICAHSVRELKDGRRISNIDPILAPGTIVSTPRAAVHYFATEYGVVNLKAKSTYERAEALIGLAHPDFREDLIKEAEKMGIWTNTSKTTY